jgi:hypothetical protein
MERDVRIAAMIRARSPPVFAWLLACLQIAPLESAPDTAWPVAIWRAIMQR